MSRPRNLVADEEVAAHVGGAGGHKSPIAIETKLGIAAVGQGSLANFACKGTLLHKLANRIIIGFLVAETVDHRGLRVGITGRV